ncbi:MAG: GNAT family N-acetyltransferase [Acidimicrobiia bacterium]
MGEDRAYDPLPLRFLEGDSALGQTRDAWERLAETLPGYGPFLGPDWAEIWWRHFGAGSTLTVGELGDGAALLPLYRTEGGVVSFVGGSEVTDYVGVVGPFEVHAPAGEALVDRLAADDDWRELHAVAVPAESGFTAAAALAAVRHGFDVTFEVEDSAILRLPGTFGAYLDMVGKKERHEIRRKERRLARELGDLELEADREWATAVEGFVAMHRLSRGDKGDFMDDVMAAFFRDAAERFGALGCLRLDTLRAGGRPVASTVGFADAHGYYLYNSAFEPAVATLSPGNVLLARLIGREIDAGRPVFDFLRGDERYKFRLGARRRPLRRLTVRRRVAR